MSKSSRLFKRAHELIDRLAQLVPPARHPAPDWDAAVAFRWRNQPGRAPVEPVTEFSAIRLQDLLGIDVQKTELDRNTRQFLHGLPANHALLWGPRGTGKSSLIKAMLNEYAGAGLRLIEVERHDLTNLPDISAVVRGRHERFVLYCDDLSFDAQDPSYKALKVVLDGSVFSTPANLLIYATSNRRHLLPEMQSENEATRHGDGELHYGEAVEEKISLSERFGVWLSFHPFKQDEYLAIVNHWIASLGGDAGASPALRTAALQWAQLHGSRSGRSAWQFAKDWVGRQALANLPDQQ